AHEQQSELLPVYAPYAPASHFFMKLVFAAPASFLPSLPTALASQASLLHFCTKLVFAAPASGLPSFPTALLTQVSCATAAPRANTDKRTARKIRFMIVSLPSCCHRPSQGIMQAVQGPRQGTFKAN